MVARRSAPAPAAQSRPASPELALPLRHFMEQRWFYRGVAATLAEVIWMQVEQPDLVRAVLDSLNLTIDDLAMRGATRRDIEILRMALDEAAPKPRKGAHPPRRGPRPRARP